MNTYFFHFLCPAGLAISPNLLRYQWLEVCQYVGAIEPRIFGELANCRIEVIRNAGYVFVESVDDITQKWIVTV